MKKIIILSVFLFFVVNAFSQKDIKVALNQTIVLTFEDHITYVQVLTTENRVKPNDNLYYYWFNANDIKVTRGGFDGKLLHGIYTEFYLNKNLKEKGEFRYGLKNGEWKSWHVNGEFQEISQWKKGKRHGTIKVYNEKGELIREEQYKKGELYKRRSKFFFLKRKNDAKEEPAKDKQTKEKEPKKEKPVKVKTSKEKVKKTDQ